MWSAVTTSAAAAAAVAPVSAAVLQAALHDTRPHAAAPCGTAVARAVVLAAGTPTTPTNVNTSQQARLQCPTTFQLEPKGYKNQ